MNDQVKRQSQKQKTKDKWTVKEIQAVLLWDINQHPVSQIQVPHRSKLQMEIWGIM